MDFGKRSARVPRTARLNLSHLRTLREDSTPSRLFPILLEPMTPPRSKYAAHIATAGDFVFDEGVAGIYRGRWREFFRARIGSSYDDRLILEIGCWDAVFLGRIAGKWPGAAFVGLDWKFKPIADAGRRMTGAGVANVALVRGRAQSLPTMFAAGEVDEVWLFHPDPCDTPVDLPNRLVREGFLLSVAAALRPGGRVCFKTDHPGYYQWVMAILGLPEPSHFSQAGPRPAGQRLRAKDLMRAEDLPPRSEAVGAAFEVSVNSANFWQDGVAGRLFDEEKTAFEQRFAGKRLPIYYVELRRR